MSNTMKNTVRLRKGKRVPNELFDDFYEGRQEMLELFFGKLLQEELYGNMCDAFEAGVNSVKTTNE